MIDPKTSVHDINFCAFDFETTGLYPPGDRIVEIGAVKFQLGQEPQEFGTLVNPQREIGSGASEVSGITNEMVATAPVIGDVLPNFLDFLHGTVLIAHNAMFDMGFLRAALQDVYGNQGVQKVTNPILDTQKLAKWAFTGQKSYALQALAQMLGLPPNQAHRAVDDSIMCMKLFAKVVDQMAFMGDMELSELLAV